MSFTANTIKSYDRDTNGLIAVPLTVDLRPDSSRPQSEYSAYPRVQVDHVAFNDVLRTRFAPDGLPPSEIAILAYGASPAINLPQQVRSMQSAGVIDDTVANEMITDLYSLKSTDAKSRDAEARAAAARVHGRLNEMLFGSEHFTPRVKDMICTSNEAYDTASYYNNLVSSMFANKSSQIHGAATDDILGVLGDGFADWDRTQRVYNPKRRTIFGGITQLQTGPSQSSGGHSDESVLSGSPSSLAETELRMKA